MNGILNEKCKTFDTFLLKTIMHFKLWSYKESFKTNPTCFIITVKQAEHKINNWHILKSDITKQLKEILTKFVEGKANEFSKIDVHIETKKNYVYFSLMP